MGRRDKSPSRQTTVDVSDVVEQCWEMVQFDGPHFYVEDDGPGVPVNERETVLESGHSSTDGGTGPDERRPVNRAAVEFGG